MYREQMVKFIRDVLIGIMSGRDFGDNPNPAGLIQRLDSDPQFKSLSEDDLLQKQIACEELSRLFWDGKDTISNYDLLLEVFHTMRPCDSDIDLLSDIMAHGISNHEPDLIKLSPDELAREAEVMTEDLPFDEDPEDDEKDSVDASKMPLRDIYSYLDQHILRQNDAKRAAATLLWEHFRGIHSAMLVLGPSGSGKSEIFKRLKDLCEQIFIVDSSTITQEGWKGSMKFSTIFRRYGADLADGGILVFDEADKMFEPKINSSVENVSYSLQSELLKIMEGEEYVIGNGEVIDTSKISFVFMGSFESLLKSKKRQKNGLGFGEDVKKSSASYYDSFNQKDLVEYAGIRREVAGRISQIVQLQPMREKDFYRILNTDSMSPIDELEKEYGKILKVSDEAKHRIAGEAAESGMGVRYLKSALRSVLEEKIFEDEDIMEYDID